jgi:hypothetical protein
MLLKSGGPAMNECVNCAKSVGPILKRFNEALLIMENKQQVNPSLIFFDNQEFIQLMHVTKRTARKWRSKGLISYTLVSNKVFYTMKDLITMIEKYHKPSLIK